MDYESLTPELKKKAIACKTPEEMLELAKEEGYELSDREIEAISGGESWGDFAKEVLICPAAARCPDIYT